MSLHSPNHFIPLVWLSSDPELLQQFGVNFYTVVTHGYGTGYGLKFVYNAVVTVVYSSCDVLIYFIDDKKIISCKKVKI